jgi:hypothetical protein
LGIRTGAVFGFNVGVPPPPALDALSPTQLKELVIQLLGEVAALKQTVAAQQAEIARLKGLKGPPSIKPSGMERATSPTGSKPGGDKQRKWKPNPALTGRRNRLEGRPGFACIYPRLVELHRSERQTDQKHGKKNSHN